MKYPDFRMTVEYLAGGQPRPYADTIKRYRVTFEGISYKTGNLEPWDYGQELILPYLKAICPWRDKPDWFDATLSYVHKISPGVWEFEVKWAYTD